MRLEGLEFMIWLSAIQVKFKDDTERMSWVGLELLLQQKCSTEISISWRINIHKDYERIYSSEARSVDICMRNRLFVAF